MKAFPAVAPPLVQLKPHVLLEKIPGMAATVLLLLLTISTARPSVAQEMPRVQVFGGYSYTRYDTRSFGFSSPTGLNGYTFSPAYNVIRGFGVVAELSGQYTTNRNLRDIAVGPQFLYPRGKMMFFAHLLVGKARSLVQVGGPQEDTARVVTLGGGMDYFISPRFALRAFQVDYLRTNLFNTTQDNLRFSTGLVYRWGSIKKTHRTLAPNP
jgi:outer membrane protein with beta-barrel domain